MVLETLLTINQEQRLCEDPRIEQTQFTEEGNWKLKFQDSR